MAVELTADSVKIPGWVSNVLASFEHRAGPYMEVGIADALQAARKTQGDLGEADWQGFLAESSAFLFLEGRGEASIWGTYFAPMGSGTKANGTSFCTPDVEALDARIVAHWEARVKECGHPVMRARYSDLIWDLKRKITGQRADPNYARIAIDSYLKAAEDKLYPMEIFGIQWLGRALDLSLSINDGDRTKHVVEFMFEFYERVAQPQFVGTWLFLFDKLYGQKFLQPEEERRIIANLEKMLATTSDKTASETGVYQRLDPWGAQAAAERLAQHYRRQGDKSNVERVIKAYGDAFKFMAGQTNSMMATAWLQPVIERYEQEGLKAEAEQLQLMSADKGKNIGADLKEYSAKVNIKTEDIEKLVESLIGGDDLNTALARVAVYFIPKVQDTRKFLEDMRTQAPLMSLIPINIIASDGHTTAKIGSLDEDPDGRLHKQLAETIGFYQPFLARTLARLREQYAPTTENVLDFLCKSPLFTESRSGLLRDGLLAYEQEDLVKAIHILVPQVEDILRNFLGNLGRPTLKTVKGYPGTMDAKSMNEVLRDEHMQAVLTENLWRYLEVVYIDKRGINLRNNLAHGLLPPNAFNRHMADRVFHTLLALSLMRSAEKGQSGGSAE
jgi:lysyl-tRNA synthetase class 1